MSKTQWLTIVGCVMAALTSVADYLAHMNMDGGAFKQPTFWVTLAIAAGMGVKGYLAQGTDVATKTAPPVAP